MTNFTDSTTVQYRFVKKVQQEKGMRGTEKHITTLLCSVAFLFCFADSLSAQKITAKTKSGYSSEVEFLDVVGDSLQFKNEAGQTLTLPLQDFESETLIEIVIQNEKKNDTSLDLKALKKLEKFRGGDLDLLEAGDFGVPEDHNPGYAHELKIGPDKDSYEWQKVLGVAGRKLVVYRGNGGDRRSGMSSGMGSSDGGPGDLGELPTEGNLVDSGDSESPEVGVEAFGQWAEKISDPPLRQYDDRSLILIATRFTKDAEEIEKAAEMSRQAEIEAAKREEELNKAAQAARNRQMERAKKRAAEERGFIPKTRFDHCVVVVDVKVVEIPGSIPIDFETVKSRTLSHDDGTTEDLGSFVPPKLDPNPGWLDELGANGWELVQVIRENRKDAGGTTSYYFKREK